MTFEKRLDYALKLRNKRPAELSRSTGLSKPLISQYLSGKIIPKSDKLKILADALQVNEDFLLGISNDIDGVNIYPYSDDKLRIPIYAPLSCGTGGFVEDDVIDYVQIPEAQLSRNKRYFGQYAMGDSMRGAGINDGDLLLFEITSDLNQGDIGCFCIDENTATCKRFTKTKDRVILVPANEMYQPITVDPLTHHFVIVGKLVSITRFIK